MPQPNPTLRTLNGTLHSLLSTARLENFAAYIRKNEETEVSPSNWL
ncbi:hypothetical protein BH10PLA2_BH10PLA2_40000 [soil metagenome]